jgi:hypothetical protein
MTEEQSTEAKQTKIWREAQRHGAHYASSPVVMKPSAIGQKAGKGSFAAPFESAQDLSVRISGSS